MNGLLALIAGLVLMFNTADAFAEQKEVRLRCRLPSLEECASRSDAALTKMNCEPLKDSIECNHYSEVDGDGNSSGKTAVYCEVKTLNCSEPKPYLAFGTSCEDKKSRTISLRKYDNYLTLNLSSDF